MPTFDRPPRPLRVQRSELAVPATSPHFFDKAAQGSADFIFLDLEDAVAPALKVEAREAAIAALNQLDWGDKTMAVRVNGLETPWGQRDILEVAGRCPRLDLILLPKVARPFDVEFVDALLTGLERERPGGKRIGLEVLIETAMGVANVEAIAAASPRLEAMIFGIGDYSVDLGTCGEAVGASDPRYAVLERPDAAGLRRRHLADQWHFALARIANACHAHGLRAIDGPYADYGDPEAFRASAERGAALGCEGKWAIHPSQVAIANEVFTPSAAQLAWAREILAELARATAEGAGAYGRKGVLIDMAVEKIARAVCARWEAIQMREKGEVREKGRSHGI